MTSNRPTTADLGDPDEPRRLALEHPADRSAFAHYAERAALSLAADAVVRRPMAELVAELRHRQEAKAAHPAGGDRE